jgi:hypothetical protein
VNYLTLDSLQAGYPWPAQIGSGTVKKLIFTLFVTIAAVGVAVAFTTHYDEPAKANAAVGIDPSLIMSHAGSLPVAHYDYYALVFN